MTYKLDIYICIYYAIHIFAVSTDFCVRGIKRIVWHVDVPPIWLDAIVKPI